MHFARFIDHTVLKATATKRDITTLCLEAVEFGFATVCVNPTRVSLCAKALVNTDVKVCTVVGFPLGADMPSIKADAAALAVEQGASEIDMVINIGALKDGDLDRVEEDIREVRSAVPKALLKVIIEACLLTDEEKVLACQIAQKAGADFVKTSTGLSTGGATAEDVALMRRTVGPEMGIKAAGGIRTYAQAMDMVHAGANRIGCSASVAIVIAAQAADEQPPRTGHL